MVMPAVKALRCQRTNCSLELGVLRLELADARFQERDPALVEFDPACGNSRRALFAFSVTNQEKSIPTEDLGDTRKEEDR
jgi:hypothetical protein